MGTQNIAEVEKPVQNGAKSFPDLFGEAVEPKVCKSPECDKIPPPGREYCNNSCRAVAYRYRADERKSDRREEFDKAWADLNKQHPEIKSLFIQKIREKINQDWTRIEGYLLWAEIRAQLKIQMNNNFLRSCKEQVLREHPEFDKYFHRRAS